MPSPSPHLQEAWVRWADRGILLRREVSLVLGGCTTKSRFLKDLREKISEHRQDDLSQLESAHREASERWDERLSRLEKWMASAGALHQTSGSFLAVRDTADWFDRAQSLSDRYIDGLNRKMEELERQLLEAVTRVKSWKDRLMVQETDLREFFERQASKTNEIVVSSARKRPYLDFVYAEREEEGRLALALRAIGRQAARAVDRFSRAEATLAVKTDVSPANFEVRQRQILDGWNFSRLRLTALSDALANEGIQFEEGRQRLRWIYEKLQQMRALPDAPARPRPFLLRLFNIQDE